MGEYFQKKYYKPLLHLWLLAVEEQFYFVWPIVLVALIKCSKSKRFHLSLVAIAILLSFSLAEFTSKHEVYSAFSYFMLPTSARRTN